MSESKFSVLPIAAGTGGGAAEALERLAAELLARWKPGCMPWALSSRSASSGAEAARG